MKPIKLIMEAFGPYSSAECVDFKEFSNKGLFLVAGPTGAGKTTIFDAIMFALYGESSGALREGDSFRSDHAKDDALTSVTLSFDIRGKSYLVKRIPRQMRPKISGSGYTQQNAEAELSGDGIALSGVREVTEYINGLFGLNAEQFRQIMMIPQGEFRRLILSDSKDKAEIFRKLFGTSLYERIQDGLKLEEDAVKRKYSDIIIKAQENGKSLKGTELKEIIEELIQNPVKPVFIKVLAEAEKYLNDDVLTLSQMRKQIKENEAKKDLTKRAISDGEILNREHERLRELKRQQEELDKKDQYIDEIKSKLALAEKADSLIVIDNKIEDLKKEHLRRTEELKVINDQKSSNIERFELVNEEYLQAKKGREALIEIQRQHSELALMKRDVEKLNEDNKEMARLSAEILRLEGALDKDKGLLSDMMANYQAVESRLYELADKKTSLFELKNCLAIFKNAFYELERLSSHGKQRDALEKSLNFLKENFNDALIDYKDADESFKRLEGSFLKGYSGVLAKNLVDGKPCPVCGGTDHPHPASEAEIVERDEVEAARNRLDEAKILYEKINLNIENVKLQIKESERVQKELGERIRSLLDEIIAITGLGSILNNIDIAYKADAAQIINNSEMLLSKLNSDLKRIDSQKNILEKELANEASLNQEKIELHERIKSCEGEIEALLLKLSEAKLDERAIKGKIDQIISKVPKEYSDYKTLNEKLISLEREINKIEEDYKIKEQEYFEIREQGSVIEERLNRANSECIKLKLSLDETLSSFDNSMLELGFGSFELYRQSKKNYDEKKLLKQLIDEFRDEKEKISQFMLDAERRISGREIVALDQLMMELSVLEELFDVLLENQEALSFKVEHNKAILESLRENVKALDAVELRFSYVSKLSKIARGNNRLRLSFENFVLSRYFEDVLRAANIRLYKMTQGRFELVRRTEKNKGNVQSGLDIDVMDHFTGKQRAIKTLSGGETFKASLALALGLSDEVQSHAGGISIETMFIDEGFGTLDSDSLDKAIDALVELSDKNKMVGIISHVQELKESITDQIVVSLTPSGSRVDIITLG